MTFRLRQVDTTADGRRIVRDKVLDRQQLAIGRAAENDIHLPDLAVEPNHAIIAMAGARRIQVRATGTLGFGLDGTTTRQAAIDARTGAELRFGASRIGVSLDEDGAVLLTVEAIVEPEGSGLDDKQRFALASALPGKRAASWALAIVILLAFLALPIASHMMRANDPKRDTVTGDQSWNPGPLSVAHHALEGRCEACHAKPFEAVRDETCIACHKDVHDHAPAGRLAVARAQPGPGGRILWNVAHAFGKPGPGACVDCHNEHETAGKMAMPQQQFCADCHGSLKDRLADTRLGDAADFGRHHPQFSPHISVDPAAGTMRAVSLDAHPREANGLTFPHRLHLDPRGGVARMAATLGGQYPAKGLTCASCHHATDDGVRFQPVRMERDCEVCHSLAYDKVGATFRKLHHGDVDQLVADLAVAGPVQPVVSGRRRPGDFAAGRPYYSSFTAPSAGLGTVGRALSRDGVCGECHTPTSRNGRPGVVPVVLPARYMTDGWFDHAAHKQTQCTECHKAPASTTSADVLMPGVAQCRTCHLGEDDSRAKVPSGCAMCHAYHPTASAPPLARSERR